MGRRALRVVAVVTAGVLLAACGGGDSGGQGEDDGSVPAGGDLRIAVGQAEPSLSVLDYKTHSFAILDQIYEPLVRYGANGTIEPGLAESWEVAPDGLTLTFRLREGVTFSDGTAFDASVAKQGVERWIADEDHGFLKVTSVTTAVEAPDPRTLVLRLTEPYYPALQELTYVRPPRFAAPAAFDASGAITTPIGTGPYKLQEATETEIVLTRNDSYWGGRPNLDRVVFTVIPSSQARVAALRAGEVDVIGGDYLAPLAPEEAVPLQGDSSVEVLTAPSSTNLLLGFNAANGNPALTDPKVREAINLAVDRDGYAKALFSGRAKPTTRLFPESIPYAGSITERPTAADADRARQLLDEAGWTGEGTRAKAGQPLTLRLILDPGMLPQAKALAEAVQADLAKIGATVEISSLDSTAYGDTASRRAYDLVFYLTYGPPYDPFGMLLGNFTTGETTNLWSSPELDGLLSTALATTDETSRQAAYDAVWKTLEDAWAVAPLVETQRVWAKRTAVKGFELGVTEYDLPLTGVGVTG